MTDRGDELLRLADELDRHADWRGDDRAKVAVATMVGVSEALRRLAAARGEPPQDHPFKDEWAFQRSMSKPYPGNAVAGQPIAPDQPCFTCGEPFSEHRAARGEPPEPAIDVERLTWASRKVGAYSVAAALDDLMDDTRSAVAAEYDRLGSE